METIIKYFTKYETVEHARMVEGHARYWSETVAVGPDWFNILMVSMCVVSMGYALFVAYKGCKETPIAN